MRLFELGGMSVLVVLIWISSGMVIDGIVFGKCVIFCVILVIVCVGSLLWKLSGLVL